MGWEKGSRDPLEGLQATTPAVAGAEGGAQVPWGLQGCMLCPLSGAESLEATWERGSMLPKGPRFQEKLKAVDACLNSKTRAKATICKANTTHCMLPQMGSVMMTAVLGECF